MVWQVNENSYKYLFPTYACGLPCILSTAGNDCSDDQVPQKLKLEA